MSNFSQKLFTEALNGIFELDLENGDYVGLKLVDVSEIKDRGAFESFSVEFLGPKNKFLEQKQYQLTHTVMGTNSIFIVPIGEQDNHFQYEAVFSYKKEV